MKRQIPHKYISLDNVDPKMKVDGTYTRAYVTQFCEYDSVQMPCSS